MTTFYVILLGILFLFVYWLTPDRHRSFLLILSNALFLIYFDWHFLFLHLISSIVNFVAALKLDKWKKQSVAIVISVIIFNVLFIFYHKIRSALFPSYLIPLGVSYYTLTNLGYFLEVFRGQQKPLKNFRDFYLSSGFFPCVTMGPIERIHHLLPQLKEAKTWITDLGGQGVFLISLGIFKKMVIADRLHDLANRAHGNVNHYEGWSLWLFFFLCLVQIYCDFSSYIDMTRGFSKLLGIHLSLNFDRPYLAKSIPEIWQRWNITLVNWLRYHLYVPLMMKTKSFILATFVVMFIMAMWHGVSSLMILWALYWTALYSLHYLFRIRGWIVFNNSQVKRALMLMVMSLSTLFFVTNSVTHLVETFLKLFHLGAGFNIINSDLSSWDLIVVLIGISIMILAESISVEKDEKTVNSEGHSKALNKLKLWLSTLGLLFVTMLLGVSQSQAFIYLRF